MRRFNSILTVSTLIYLRCSVPNNNTALSPSLVCGPSSSPGPTYTGQYPTDTGAGADDHLSSAFIPPFSSTSPKPPPSSPTPTICGVTVHVALSGLCLDKEPIAEHDALKVVMRQCKEVQELVVNPAHVPLQGAAWMLNIVRRCLHHRQKIRFIVIPGIDAHDLDVEHAFDGLDDICPSLQLIQFHQRKWECVNGKWTEIDM
ncbi:hypothetical protein F5051DRAFT_440739 [Lentinula edodes]|nr:hypothetical protein F5051DRAFT_440739 [Lentinula edodes]